MIEKKSSSGLPSEVQRKLDLFFQDLKQLGISYIGHGIISDAGDHTGYFSNKTWGSIYIENGFFFKEPLLDNFEKSPLDLISWTSIPDKTFVAHIRYELTSLHSGLTLRKSLEGYDTFFNLGFKENIDLAQFAFLKKELLLAYFDVFNDYHLLWRKEKKLSRSPFLIT